MTETLLRKATALLVALQLTCSAGAGAVRAQEQETVPAPLPSSEIPPPPPASAEMRDRHTFRVSPPELLAPGQYRIGGIIINKKEKTLSFPAEVNMDRGLLEYLLVRTGGKTHESLLRTRVEPYNLQIASLLLGIEGSSAPLPFQGSAETPKGDPVEITLQVDGGERRQETVKPEAWITQVADGVGKDAPALSWVFSGSVVVNGRFRAQVDGSMISVFRDPVALFDNASPGGENDQLWHVKEGAVPPVGTAVTVSIRSLR